MPPKDYTKTYTREILFAELAILRRYRKGVATDAEAAAALGMRPQYFSRRKRFLENFEAESIRRAAALGGY